MATFTWDHIHLRTPDQEATAQWFERMFGAQIIRSTQLGKPRIDMKLGGANIFLAQVKPGDGVNAAPPRPIRGSTISGWRLPASTPSRPILRRRASSSPRSRIRRGPVSRSASCAGRRAFRSSCSIAIRNGAEGNDVNSIRILAVLALALTGSQAGAQQKNLRDQIVGTWNFVVAEVVAPDGKKSFPFGETPKGVLIFTADGHFAQIHVASDVPKIASGNRLTGTPEEYAIIMRRSISVFGDYSVNEEKKTVTFKIVSATYPNWQGEAQERSIDKLTADEFSQHQPQCRRRTRQRIKLLSAGEIGDAGSHIA